MKFVTVVLCLFGVIACSWALESFEAGATSCQSEIKATTGEVQNVLQHKVPNSKTEECLLACMAKKWGIIKPDNSIDMDVVKQNFVSLKKQSEEMYDKTINAFEECSKIEIPSDECAAAAKYMECMHKKDTAFKSKV